MINKLTILTTMLAVLLASSFAHAVKIADVTRIYGQQNNVLNGFGLVIGLKGTGDGGDYGPTIKPLLKLLENYNNPSTLAELSKTANVSLVMVTVTLPTQGVRKGDRFDCRVMTLGPTTSLRGGHLIATPLAAKGNGTVFGLADGTVVIEDPATPTSGVIKGGFQAEVNLTQPAVQQGRYLTLIIDDAHASWGLASNIAQLINTAYGVNGENYAVARDPRTIEITIPEPEQANPDKFIAYIQSLPISVLPQEARVLINTKTSTIIVTGDVEISPVVISYKGLTITTITPRPTPTAVSPSVEQRTFIPVGTGVSAPDGPSPSTGKLQDLVNALEQLRVPADDRIAIIKELHKSGKLHARLIVDGVMP